MHCGFCKLSSFLAAGEISKLSLYAFAPEPLSPPARISTRPIPEKPRDLNLMLINRIIDRDNAGASSRHMTSTSQGENRLDLGRLPRTAVGSSSIATRA
jgi:hypothetical protein